jgi:hypothetical protein
MTKYTNHLYLAISAPSELCARLTVLNALRRIPQDSVGMGTSTHLTECHINQHKENDMSADVKKAVDERLKQGADQNVKEDDMFVEIMESHLDVIPGAGFSSHAKDCTQIK